MKETGNGNLLLVVEGEHEMTDRLEKEIRNKLYDVKVSTKSAMTALFIMGIESATNEDEQALVRETNTKITGINTKALRTGKYEEKQR
ncbi:hypothetical protein Trydic_g15733 [Trypoxylus dichotomus]